MGWTHFNNNGQTKTTEFSIAPRVRITPTSTTNITNTGSGQSVSLNSGIEYDTHSFQSGTSITIPSGMDGTYHIDATVEFPNTISTADGIRAVAIHVNTVQKLKSAHSHTFSTGNSAVTISGDLELVAGDVIDLRAAHTSGTTPLAVGNNKTCISMHRVFGIATKSLLLRQIEDVSLTSLATQDTLRYDGSNWVNTIDPLSIWTPVHFTSTIILANTATGTYLCSDIDEAPILNNSGNAAGLLLFKYTASKFPAITGKTLKFRIVARSATTAAQGTSTLNVGLHTVTAISGTTTLIINAATAVSGSATGAFTNNTANTIVETIGGEFAASALTEGNNYIIAVIIGTAASAASSVMTLNVALEKRYV